MSPYQDERRLTTILAADVAGFSRLMHADEPGTIAALKVCEKTIIEPKIAQYRGRIVKRMGDGLLVEFPSVVRAVCCAVEIQNGLSARNAKLAVTPRIEYRIGINIGDVVVADDDIFGDGVNVAVRIEGLAEPGGICIARNVVNQVRGKLDLTLENLGKQQVKNIADPITVFRIAMDAKATALATPVHPMPGFQRRHVALAVGGVLAMGLVAVAWWLPWSPAFEPVAVEDMAYPLPDKPSIAVLPFENLSSDSAQEYFADGITEDLRTDLSKIPELFVVARNSAFAYKEISSDVRRVSQELGIRYVLGGSVRRLPESVRINVQLIDATTGGHRWAERFDIALDELHILQDEVLHQIVAALSVTLAIRPNMGTAWRSNNPEAYDAFLQGWAHYRSGSPNDFALAIPYFERALALDPTYSRANAALAALYSEVIERNWSTGTSIWSLYLGLTTDEVAGKEGVHLAAALSDASPLAHRVAAGRHLRAGKHEAAIDQASQAIALDPNDPVAHEALASALIYAGRPAEAEVEIRNAMRLDPLFPGAYLFWLGLAQFNQERFLEAAETLGRAAQMDPDDDRVTIILAAAQAFLGEVDAAQETIKTTNRKKAERQKHLASPGWRPGIDMLLVGPYTLEDVDWWFFKQAADRDRLRDGLRLAGVPDSDPNQNVSPVTIPGTTTVDTAEAKRLFDRGVAFVDVRGPESWNSGHIPGAINLPLESTFQETTLSARFAKETAFVIYCMGPRCLLSSEACTKAVSWGFSRVYYFRDGFPAWKAAGNPVATP